MGSLASLRFSQSMLPVGSRRCWLAQLRRSATKACTPRSSEPMVRGSPAEPIARCGLPLTRDVLFERFLDRLAPLEQGRGDS